MSLITRYRPNNLDEVKGNEATIESIKSILERPIEKQPKAWLFSGPPGCGKTTLGRIIASELKCSKDDLNEINSADYTGIDGIRELIKKMSYKAFSGKVKVYLLDEVHRLSAQAQDALLKAVEEPPKHVFFILCTTEPKKIAKALQRRCSHYTVKPLTTKESMRFIISIGKNEDVKLPKDLIKQVAEDSLGQPGDILSILDKVIGLPPDEMLEVAKKRDETESQVIELCRAMIAQSNWSTIAGILKGIDEDEETVRRIVMGYFNKVLLSKGDKKDAIILEEFLEPFYDSGKPGLTLACFRATQG